MQKRDMILISGGAGYVGSLLIQELQKLYFLREKMVCIDPGWFGYNDVHDNCLMKKNIYKCSVSEFLNTYSGILTDTKIVIHLAGLSNDPMADYDMKANDKINYDETSFLVDACIKHEVPRFVFASSASVYGDMEENLCHESGLISPKSNYAMSKAKAENYIMKKVSRIFKPIILRKGTLYGVSPRMRLDLAINTMVANAVRFGKLELYGGGENWRPLTHILDAVHLYCTFVDIDDDLYKSLSGKIYNVVGNNYRMSELGLKIADIMKVNVIPRYDMPKDVRTYRMDGARLRQTALFDFRESMRLSHTIEELRKWMINKDLDNPVYYNMKWIKNCEKVFKCFNMDFKLS